MLRTIYPKLVGGCDMRVRSYLEILADHMLPATAPQPSPPNEWGNCARSPQTA
jgi:hypothetical protein